MSAAVKNWNDLGLSDELIQVVVNEGLKLPTPVQQHSIERAIKKRDLIVTAQTGTGKTAAFVLPMIDRFKGRKGTFGLVLAPTREIALQIEAVIQQFGTVFGVTSASLIGGTGLKEDEVQLREYPQILIATPGRLCDHIERGNVWLEFLEVVVLDEADRMLDMGFASQLDTILNQTSTSRQTLLFSATMTEKVEKLANNILYQPVRIRVGKTSKSADTVTQKFLFVDDRKKFNVLQDILWNEKGSIIVFTRSKDAATQLWRDLRNRGFHEATQLHSNLSQEYREESLADFKSGKYRVLIATDVMARGIHVDQVAHVINYDFPRDPEDYVHRIGRTGRAKSKGVATSMVSPKDRPNLKRVEDLIGMRVNQQGDLVAKGKK